MNKNQLGGARPNAGRKKGSKNKPRITDYFAKDDIDEMVELAKEQAKKNPRILQFLLEQIFGKAKQSVEGDLNGNFILEWATESQSPTIQENGQENSTTQTNDGEF